VTAHLHSTLVDGCFRCELGKDEAAAQEREEREQIAREKACSHEWEIRRSDLGGQWAACPRCGAERDL
jgi:hypothetical protein